MNDPREKNADPTQEPNTIQEPNTSFLDEDAELELQEPNTSALQEPNTLNG